MMELVAMMSKMMPQADIIDLVDKEIQAYKTLQMSGATEKELAEQFEKLSMPCTMVMMNTVDKQSGEVMEIIEDGEKI